MSLARSTAASAVLFLALVAGAFVYTATGGAARDLLVQELLVNLLLVLGLQAFIGNTGILSFGHLAFAQIAAYGTALVAIPVATKASSLPDLPFGLGDVALGPVGATAVGVAVAVFAGAAVGVAVARAGGLAATMITLAVLFVVDQGVKNWQELTRGAGGLSGRAAPRHEHVAVGRRARRPGGRHVVPRDACSAASPWRPGRTRSPLRRSASTASRRVGRRGR